MTFIMRKFGTLAILVLIVGIAWGAVLSQRKIPVILGPVLGVRVSLGEPTPKPATALVAAVPAPAPVAGTSSGANLAASRPITGTVQLVSGTSITLTVPSGALARATVMSTTTYMKNSTITIADIKVGDSVAVTGQTAADGSMTALQVTDGATAQTGGAGGFTRQAGGGSGRFGAGASGNTGGTGVSSSGTFSGTSRFAGGQASPATVGTVQSIDNGSMTIVDQGGLTTKVILSASTRLRKTTAVTLTDIAAGDQVTIIGPAAEDGSITATVVQISNPS